MRPSRSNRSKGQARGFSLIELMLSMTVLAVGLLAVAGMFTIGHKDVTGGGKITMAAAASRQILEDVRTLPFANIANLNGFDTNSIGTLPASDPERAIARKWRYAIAGDGAGWGFTTDEKARWSSLSLGGKTVFGGRGQIAVVNQTASLRLVTVTVTAPGRPDSFRVATLISRL